MRNCCRRSTEQKQNWVRLALGFPGGSSGKESACQCSRLRQVQALGGKDPLKEGIAMHSSTPAWRTLWTEDPGELQSIGSQRVGRS